eukprot:s1023_g8.t1
MQNVSIRAVVFAVSKEKHKAALLSHAPPFRNSFCFAEVRAVCPMADKAKAAEAKKKGNEEFQAKNFKDAIKHFTEAIKHDPSDHVFFSNRSACYASLENYDKALEDGAECVRLKPDWPKGYTRKGLAEYFLQKYDDAAETYKAGLKLAPEDATLKEGLKKAMDAKYDVPGAGDAGITGSHPK